MRKHIQYIIAIFIMPIIAIYYCIRTAIRHDHSISDFFRLFFYQYHRLHKMLMLWARNIPAYYYRWQREKGGLGKARLFYRIPKVKNWIPAHDWWVLREFTNDCFRTFPPFDSLKD